MSNPSGNNPYSFEGSDAVVAELVAVFSVPTLEEELGLKKDQAEKVAGLHHLAHLGDDVQAWWSALNRSESELQEVDAQLAGATRGTSDLRSISRPMSQFQDEVQQVQRQAAVILESTSPDPEGARRLARLLENLSAGDGRLRTAAREITVVAQSRHARVSHAQETLEKTMRNDDASITRVKNTVNAHALVADNATYTLKPQDEQAFLASFGSLPRQFFDRMTEGQVALEDLTKENPYVAAVQTSGELALAGGINQTMARIASHFIDLRESSRWLTHSVDQQSWTRNRQALQQRLGSFVGDAQLLGNTTAELGALMTTNDQPINACRSTLRTLLESKDKQRSAARTGMEAIDEAGHLADAMRRIVEPVLVTDSTLASARVRAERKIGEEIKTRIENRDPRLAGSINFDEYDAVGQFVQSMTVEALTQEHGLGLRFGPEGVAAVQAGRRFTTEPSALRHIEAAQARNQQAQGIAIASVPPLQPPSGQGFGRE